MYYDVEEQESAEADAEREERAGMRCAGFLFGVLVIIAVAVLGIDAYQSEERKCVAAGGDPWHCAQEYGE